MIDRKAGRKMFVRIMKETTKDDWFDKTIECNVAHVMTEKNENGKAIGILLIVDGDVTYSLDKGEVIYYMNNQGKTIHKACFL